MSTRRDVVKAIATLPAAATLGRLAYAAPTLDRKLGVALCGLGGYSTRTIAPEFPFAEHVRLAGVVTGDPEGKGRRWAAEHGFPETNVFTYETMDRLADRDDIDIVHVVTPNSLHAEHTVAALRAGKHVMCEKPMATTAADCEAMIAAAAEAGRYLGVDYRLQFEPHHVGATDLLRDGAAGDLVSGSYEFSWGYYNGLKNRPGRVKRWLLDPAMAGGGAMFDTGVYPVQAGCYLARAEPVSVRGLPATRHPEFFGEGVEETMSFEMTFPDGFQALGRAGYGYKYHNCMTRGTTGWVEVVGNESGSAFSQSGDGKPNRKRLFRGKQEVVLEDTLQVAVLLDRFAVAIKRNEPFVADGAMGLRDIRIIEAVYRSAAKGGASVSV
ncbi:MAG: Gfo/Idh/MocA family oxidoreductase [Planctomycetota bacterium]